MTEMNKETCEISPDRIAELESNWDEAILFVAKSLYPDTDFEGLDPKDCISIIEALSHSNYKASREPSLRLIGLAGPGASGKGTLSEFLLQYIGLTKIVNSTTRPQRTGEIEGVHYHFLDDKDFVEQQDSGGFFLTLERPGRGYYGVAVDEVEKKLSSGKKGVLVEENPKNLITLLTRTEENYPHLHRTLIYIFPPHPIIKNTMQRLRNRLKQEEEPDKRNLTPDVFESTLGERQINEFRELASLSGNPGINLLFITNDDLAGSQKKLADLISG